MRPYLIRYRRGLWFVHRRRPGGAIGPHLLSRVHLADAMDEVCRRIRTSEGERVAANAASLARHTVNAMLARNFAH